MDKPRVYLESSVVSYRVAWPSRDVVVAGHQKITHLWWDNHLNEYEACISEFVLEEIQRGDSGAADEQMRIASDFPILPASAEVEPLAACYMRDLQLPQRALYDALHIATASVHGIEYLLTWNCMHIANAHLRRRLSEINMRMGVFTPIICTPEELLDEDTLPEPDL